MSDFSAIHANGQRVFVMDADYPGPRIFASAPPAKPVESAMRTIALRTLPSLRSWSEREGAYNKPRRVRLFSLRTCLSLITLVSSFAVAAPSVYVANEKSGSISVIDTDHNAVARVLRDAKRPGPIAASPDGEWLYVTSVVAALRERSRGVGTLEEEKRRVRSLWRDGGVD
jgi:DNA-binding beta-propeller fold protein YncE